MANGTPRASRRRLHDAAWPDMFANLHTAYAELTRAQFDLETRAAEVDEARELFQRVIESMSEALFLMDRSGRIVQANPAAALLLEMDGTTLTGEPFAQIIGTAEIPATPWQLLERAETSSLSSLEVEIQTRSGRMVPVSASCRLVRDRWGKIIGMLVVAQDITGRKRAEESLERQAQELARSNADLEQFAYVASHDLQEPLRMMASFAQLLQAEYKERLDPDADEYINYMVEGAARMQRLISDLLTYSRVGTRGKPFRPTDIEAVVRAACDNLRAVIEESGAVVTRGSLPTLPADETQLVQLFQNLIGNAIKFRGSGPPEVKVEAESHEGHWLFRVQDNGIGIDPRYTPRIFIIFQRLHTQAEHPGTGIGLAICKKIVERHGGRIWVESEEGKGSTFCFTLRGEKE